MKYIFKTHQTNYKRRLSHYFTIDTDNKLDRSLKNR